LQLDAHGRGTLADTAAASGLTRWAKVSSEAGTPGCVAAGLGLFLIFSLARLRLSRWPLHPVIFLVWGTFPANRFAFSLLLGWLLKSAMIHLGWVRLFNQ